MSFCNGYPAAMVCAYIVSRWQISLFFTNGEIQPSGGHMTHKISYAEDCASGLTRVSRGPPIKQGLLIAFVFLHDHRDVRRSPRRIA